MKVLFVSLGCDKNLVDSEHMLGDLIEHGFTICDDEAEADIIVVNTCSFIADAMEESIQNIIDHEGDNVRLVTDRFRAGEYDIFKIENAPFGHKLQQDVVPIDMLNIDNGVVHKVRLIQDWRTTDKYNAVCFSDQAWVLTTTVIFNVKLHKEINGKKRFFPHIESIISGDLYCGTSILEKDGCAPSLANKAKGEGISVLEAKHIGIDLVWIRPTTDLRNALRDRLYKKDFSKSMLDRWNAANLRQRLHMAIDTQGLNQIRIGIRIRIEV